MGRSERRKGVDGELEVRDLWRAGSFNCDRVPNSGGLRIKGDLYGDVPELHIEVKRQERLQLWLWLEQAEAEAAEGVTPAVFFRRNRSRWYVTVPAEYLIDVLFELRTATTPRLDELRGDDV